MISAPAGLATRSAEDQGRQGTALGRSASSVAAHPEPAETWARLCADYRLCLERRSLARATVTRYCWLIARFVDWCEREQLGLETLTSDDIRRFVSELRKRLTRNANIEQMVAVRSLFNFLVEAGIRAETPVFKPRRPPAPVVSRPINEPWADGFRLWMLSSGYARATVKSSVYATLFFSRWCGEQGITAEHAQASDAARFIVGELERTNQKTANRKLTSLRNFYAFLIADGQRPDDPTVGIKIKEPPLSAKEPLDPAGLSRLLDAAGSVRNRAILLVFIRTGCRWGEVAEMKTDDIDWERALLTVTGKGSKQRVVALGQEALGALREYLGDRTGRVWIGESATGKGEPLTRQGIYLMVKRVAKRAGVSVHPHKLRTSFACRWMDNSPDILALQILMGHSKIETTAHYARWGASKRALEQQAKMLDEGLL